MAECIPTDSLPDVKFTPGMIVTSIILSFIIVIVLVGNSLVITAVIKTRKLRTVTNIFIVSLACSDLLLGVCVLPFSTALEVLDYWPFGDLWCSMWLAIDVLLCTASILNLCAISLDRFLAVTRPIKYHSLMSKRRGRIMVSLVWLLSFVISFPPLIGWNDERLNISFENGNDVINSKYTRNSSYSTSETNMNESATTQGIPCVATYPKCELTSTHGYRIYASMGSFYIPIFVMVSFNCRIYLAAVRTVSSLRSGVLTSKRVNEFRKNKCSESEVITLRVHRGGAPLARPSCVSNRRSSHYAYQDLFISSSSGKQYDSVSDKNKTQRYVNVNGRLLFHNYSGRNSNYQDYSCENGKQDSGDCVPCISITGDSGSSNTVERCNESPYMKRKTNRCISTPMLNERSRSMIFITNGRSSQKQHIRKILRETKAAKTVAIIIGVFIVCWLPFFIIYLIGAFCDDCTPPIVFSILFWLGYCNSMFNPFIYGMFSRDFRIAFRRILYCRGLGNSNFFSRAKEPCLKTRHNLGIPMLESESFSDYPENTV